MPLVLVDLAPLLLGLLALALAALSVILIKALIVPLVNTIRKIPAVGGAIADPIETAVHGLLGVLYGVEQGADHLIGWSWHNLAKAFDELWAQIKANAKYIGIVSPLIAQLVWMVSHLHTRVNGLHNIGRGINDAIGRLEKAWHGIEHRVRAIERELGRGIGHDLRIRVKALEGELGKVEHTTIPGLRQGIATAEGEVTALQKWIARNIPVPGTAEFAAAVAVAIAALGIFPRNCSSWGRFFNRQACGLWQGLEDLLGLIVDVFLFTHFCDLWAAATPLLETFLSPLVGMISTFADGACSHRPSDWQTMGVSLDLPTPKELTVTVELP